MSNQVEHPRPEQRAEWLAALADDALGRGPRGGLTMTFTLRPMEDTARGGHAFSIQGGEGRQRPCTAQYLQSDFGAFGLAMAERLAHERGLRDPAERSSDG